MRNTLLFKKLWLIVSFLLLNVLAVNAKVNVTSFSLPSTYLVSDKLNIPNPTVATLFQFNISFLRALLSNGSFESVSGSSITLVYSDCNFCGNYTEISTTRNLSEADFYQGSTNWPSSNAHLTLSAELPANKTTGFLMVKHVYFDSNQNKTLTEYISSTTIGVQVSNNYINPATLSKISSMGFDIDGIISGNDYYLVEGDIRLMKSSINNPIGTIYTVDNTFAQNINLEIDNSMWANFPWYQGLQTAIYVWNSVPGSNIKFNLIVKEQVYATTPRIDVTLRGDGGSLPSNVATNAFFPAGDGKPGKSIIFNSDFNGGNFNQMGAAWNLIHAIGHVVGLKHNTSNVSMMLKNSFQNTYSNQSYSMPINDAAEIGNLYPLNSNDLPQLYIRGTNGHFDVSYSSKEAGIIYNWLVSGTNGTIYSYSETGLPFLSDLNLESGSYKVECNISGGKYNNTTSFKDIIVN